MSNENSNEWPDAVIERLKPYAERMELELAAAIKQFVDFLGKEFGVTDPLSEDEFYLSQWAEQFVIETRNLGPTTSGGRDTVTFVGYIVGVDEYINDLRKNQMSNALSAWDRNSTQAIDTKTIGVVSAKEGRWHVNGEPTSETIDGDNLPWFGFEHDGRVLCLLNQNQSSPNVGKPMAPSSEMRTVFFLGNTEDKFDSQITLWRIGVQGVDMKAEYQIGEACKIQVVSPKEGSDNLYTNRGFAKSIVYTDEFVSEELRAELTPERFLVNDRIHNEFEELDDLLEAYDERKGVRSDGGGFTHPYIITRGTVSRLNRESNDSQYDQTGRSYRLAITSLGVQNLYGKDSPMSEVTVWIPGRVHDDTHPFEFKDDDGEWQPYAERTTVIIFGKLRLSIYNNETTPSITAYGVYVPRKFARPGVSGGDTSLDQFGGDE